jgi:hypothetical protein
MNVRDEIGFHDLTDKCDVVYCLFRSFLGFMLMNPSIPLVALVNEQGR